MWYFSILTICLLAFFGCSNLNSETSLAKERINVARKHYYAKDLIAAQKEIDTILSLYSYSIVQKFEVELLLDSIKKEVNKSKLNIIDQQISEYKREMYLNKKDLSNEIDSLESLKKPYRNVLSELMTKEAKRSAKCQCRTIIQQRR